MVDSESTRRDLESLTGGDDPRTMVIPLGVDIPPEPGEEEVEAVLGKHDLSAGYMLFVGTIEPRKNLSRLVQAYTSLGAEEKRKAGELVLVGSAGWMGRRELTRVLSQQGVRWLGFLPQAELEAVYAAAGFFVYPSLYEGFGLPVLEAMARGLAVVTSRTSSLREVGEGVALLVDPEDPRDISIALGKMIADPDLRRELARKGKDRAAAFSWDRTVDLTLKAYNAALA
jgi:alpha-1,3-rhamnosyl/mannosyltransferase